jgi:hypothetical protein
MILFFPKKQTLFLAKSAKCCDKYFCKNISKIIISGLIYYSSSTYFNPKHPMQRMQDIERRMARSSG